MIIIKAVMIPTSGGPEIPLLEMEIVNVSPDIPPTEEAADFLAQVAVNRGADVFYFSKVIADFPRSKSNVISLIRRFFEFCDWEQLKLNGDISHSSQRQVRELLPKNKAR